MTTLDEAMRAIDEGDRTVSIKQCVLSVADVEKLAKAIEKSTTLLSLSLMGCHIDDAGRTLPGVSANGRTLIEGQDGARYRIIVRNATTARFEIVASVDGLDVIDGKTADPNRRGYIVDPHDTLVIDGFRTSDANVAAFRFGAVAESYAAQTSGDRNVGIVGLAIFSERGATWSHGELHVRDTANPFPSRGYSVPPR